MQTWYHDTDDVSPIFPGLQWFFFWRLLYNYTVYKYWPIQKMRPGPQIEKPHATIPCTGQWGSNIWPLDKSRYINEEFPSGHQTWQLNVPHF
jgi:hypothetical protein